MTRAIALALLALTTASAGAQERRTENAFTWDGTITAGHTLYVRNLNGRIRVGRATGGKAEVSASKRWRRGNPDEVRIEARRSGDNVVVCAIWREDTRCDEDGYRTRGEGWRGRDNDTSVEFTVTLPAGVKLVASSINGDLDITGATAEVEASTVNGGIDAASTGGPVHASTVNGSIVVKMRELGTEDLDFSTVNGSIEVSVPDGLDAEVDMRTVNGGVQSDFPMTVSGRLNPRRINATIGKGGRRLRFSTVNGSVELRKG